MEILTALVAVAVAIPVGSFLRRNFGFGDREWRASHPLFLAEAKQRFQIQKFPDRLSCCGGGNSHSER